MSWQNWKKDQSNTPTFGEISSIKSGWTNSPSVLRILKVIFQLRARFQKYFKVVIPPIPPFQGIPVRPFDCPSSWKWRRLSIWHCSHSSVCRPKGKGKGDHWHGMEMQRPQCSPVKIERQRCPKRSVRSSVPAAQKQCVFHMALACFSFKDGFNFYILLIQGI